MSDNYLFSKTHEWVKKIDEHTVLVGISEHAVEEMGDLVFINLPFVETSVSSGDVLADVESVKAVSDIYSPVSGVIIEVNEGLVDAPEQMNESPKEAWIAKINEVEEITGLMTEEEYLSYIKEN